MNVWILHPALDEAGEERLRARTDLPLPMEPGLPDFSQIHSPAQLRHLLRSMSPGDPPERIAGRQERLWKMVRGPRAEDVVAVPMHARRKVAFAEITGPYRCQRNERGENEHVLPVTWFSQETSFRAFRKHKEFSERPQEPRFAEVRDPQARACVRDRLPYRYNRFAKLKWLLLFLFGMKVLYVIHAYRFRM